MWSQAFAAVETLAPHGCWRRRLAEAIRRAADARFVMVMTCAPGCWLQSHVDCDPPELEHLREEVVVSRLTTVAAGQLSAPLDEPALAEYRGALALRGVSGYVVVFLATPAGQLLGSISVGSALPSEALVARVGESLAGLAVAASHVAVMVIQLAGAFYVPIAEPSTFVLTPRERQIAELLCEGLSDLNVGTRLGISEETVGTHVRRIYRKLDVHTRSALVARISRYLLA